MTPVAGARTVSSAPAQLSGSGGIGAALHWVEDLVGLWPQGHRGSAVHRKDGPLGGGGGGTMQPNGGSCVNPDGRTNPFCGGGGGV